MRRKLLSTIVLLFFISANGNLLFAWEENSFTYSSQNQKNSISEKKIYEARILHLYIQRYLERIESSVEKYNLNNPSLVAHSYRSINDMLLELEKIMNKDYGEEQAEKIMTNIVKDIKKVNTDFKSYIQQLEKRRSEELISERKKYLEIGAKISTILDEMILSYSNKLIKKTTLSEKDMNIIRSLSVLRQKNIRIKNFQNINFQTKDELKQYFREIIYDIRLEIRDIKSF